MPEKANSVLWMRRGKDALALWAVPRRHVGIGPVIAWGAMFAGFVVYAALSG